MARMISGDSRAHALMHAYAGTHLFMQALTHAQKQAYPCTLANTLAQNT